MTTAINEITQNGTTTSKTDQVSVRTIVLPNSFYAGYEALAARLADAQPGTELHAYVVPQSEVGLTVKSVAAEELPSPAGILAVRRYEITFHNPAGRPRRHRTARCSRRPAGAHRLMRRASRSTTARGSCASMFPRRIYGSSDRTLRESAHEHSQCAIRPTLTSSSLRPASRLRAR